MDIKLIKKICLLWIIIFFFTACQKSSEELSVVRVVDGDTIIVKIDNQEEKVRLIGIDTPESVHRDPKKNTLEGKIASQYTGKRLQNKSVRLEFDVQQRDHYGRLLAYVYLDDKMINEELLEKGLAMTYTVPPNIKYQERFYALQKKAQKNNVGIWNHTEDLEKKYVDEKGRGLIKGNINQNRKIDPKKGERWFKTEQEAINAGFERSRN